MSSRQPVIELKRELVALDEIVDVRMDAGRGSVSLVCGVEIEIDERDFARIVHFIRSQER